MFWPRREGAMLFRVSVRIKVRVIVMVTQVIHRNSRNIF
tara:strand:+ start:620 stop:736 length:117 start_codon:yes stop_codon:yes gene_type:complete